MKTIQFLYVLSFGIAAVGLITSSHLLLAASTLSNSLLGALK